MNQPLTNAIATLGIMLLINAAGWKGMILDKIRIRKNYMTDHGWIYTTVKDYLDLVPEWISKPLWDCLICMAPWYGLAAGWILYGSWTTASGDQMVYFGLLIWSAVITDTYVIAKREGNDG